MDNAKDQLLDRLRSANHILVCVSRNPSVDQLSALLGLTLMLNKQGRHAAAVFSGNVPSTIEFLQPEETFEKNTDSLRDFIIALDKNKADKLRYKLEDDVVRIFITPYKTSISEEDFDFSQGDFNVDLVVALGVHQQEDLDDAITAHGRILHDATVASINTLPDGGLGTINVHEPEASSLSEVIADFSQNLGENLLDQQIATALLTGIVAETDRFSNDKTTSRTMSLSGALMTAGANQQLVASKLAEPAPSTDDSTDQPSDEPTDSDEAPSEDGTIQIEHDSTEGPHDESHDSDSDKSDATDAQEGTEAPHIPGAIFHENEDSNDAPPALELPAPDENAAVEPAPVEHPAESLNTLSPGSKLITEPPALGGTLTANSSAASLEPTTDPLSVPDAEPPQLLDRGAHSLSSTVPDAADPTTPAPAPTPSPTVEPSPSSAPAWTPPAPTPEPAAPDSNVVTPSPSPEPSGTPVTGLTPPPPAWVPPSADPLNLNPTDPATPASDPTLSELEQSIGSPHVSEPVADVEDARDEVDKALNDPAAAQPAPAPIAALNAQPLGGSLHDNGMPSTLPTDQPAAGLRPLADTSTDDGTSTPAGGVVLPSNSDNSQQPQVIDPNAPPPVPPPIPFEFGKPSQQ